jgi:hypothetical protein
MICQLSAMTGRQLTSKESRNWMIVPQRYETRVDDVGLEVFTAVVMKSIIFWDMTPCSPLSCTRRFGGTYRLHLQGRRIVQQTIE